jgi:hypothetical protein
MVLELKTTGTAIRRMSKQMEQDNGSRSQHESQYGFYGHVLMVRNHITYKSGTMQPEDSIYKIILK